MRTLQRVVMPVDRDLDVLELYVDGNVVHGTNAVMAKTATAGEAREAREARELDAKARWPGHIQETQTSRRGDDARRATTADSAEIVGRRSLIVPPGTRISLCTYFNAFPAAYWRRWSSLDQIVLRVRVRGEGTVLVYRSTAKGDLQRVKSVNVDSPCATVEQEVPLPLAPFIDGGWYWLELVAGAHEIVLERAEWCADVDQRQGTATIGITTFNRPEFAVDQLLALAQSGDVLEAIDEILVIDQGTRRVADQPAFAEAAAELGARLRVIDQGNLGGSGGFARAMDETLRAGRSDYVLLLDDDIVTETEGILRAVAFADLARTPTIVGGHMFNFYARSQLHAFAEIITPYRWWWEPAEQIKKKHDFANKSLLETRWLHRRFDSDYNGWWMCLIPTRVIEKIGLSMPMFIKWDDAEYCVRAKQAGFPTVSLPGMAVWHVPWDDKDDGTDWQAYFHERNRLVTALLHSPYERGGNLLKESLYLSFKHALAMRYSTAELMLMAIEDVLGGPSHLHAQITTKVGEIRAFRAGFADAQARGDLDEFPDVRRVKPAKRGRLPSAPSGTVAVLRSAMAGALHQLRPIEAGSRANPQVAIAHIAGHWAILSRFDSALVSSADGTTAAWYQRDPRRFRSLVVRSTTLHARLTRAWPALSRDYRSAVPELCSSQAWRETFGASGSGRS